VYTRAVAAGLVAAGALALVPGVAAHAGSLGATSGPVSVPSWLYFLTGGGVVAGSFLATSFLTDRALVRSIHGWRRRLPGRSLAAGRSLVRAAGVAVLAAVVAVGLAGPADAVTNLAVLVVWVGWWAGYTATTYLVGNTWPALNPWRTLADWLPSLERPLPADAGWLSTAGLLVLIWVEVVSPLADAPRLLASAVLVYTVLTLVGAVVYADWFDRVDPVARVFRTYGSVAPVGWSDGPELRLPGSALVGRGDGREANPHPGHDAAPGGGAVTDGGDGRPGARDGGRRLESAGDVAFVVALLWGTTFDGLVTTAPWSAGVRALAGVGVPPVVSYPAALVLGFAGFYGAYQWAARTARRVAGTPLPTATIAVRFAGALLPIAAAYHLAHYLGYLLTFLPALGAVATDPLSPGGVPALVLPDWFGAVGLVLVVLGHVVAVWVAHAVAFDLFTGRLQPVRSQYPYVVVMVLYTMVSMWILAQPYTEPALT
jgi:hypothetical protein